MLDLRPDTQRFLNKCLQSGFKVVEGEDLTKVCRHITWNLTSRDGRYDDEDSAVVLETMIRNSAVKVEHIKFQTTLTDVEQIVSSNLMLRCSHVQQYDKAVLTLAMVAHGYEVDGYEQRTYAGIADVTAHNARLSIVGECSMCRIDKVAVTLSASDAEGEYQLWHLPTWPYRGEVWEKNSWFDPRQDLQTFSIYAYKRGPNWDILEGLLTKSLIES